MPELKPRRTDATARPTSVRTGRVRATPDQVRRLRSYEWSLTRFQRETGLSFGQACKIRRSECWPQLPPKSDRYAGWAHPISKHRCS